MRSRYISPCTSPCISSCVVRATSTALRLRPAPPILSPLRPGILSLGALNVAEQEAGGRPWGATLSPHGVCARTPTLLKAPLPPPNQTRARPPRTKHQNARSTKAAEWRTLSPAACAAPTRAVCGGTDGPDHQHFFVARMDMAVDGTANRVVEVDVEADPPLLDCVGMSSQGTPNRGSNSNATP